MSKFLCDYLDCFSTVNQRVVAVGRCHSIRAQLHERLQIVSKLDTLMVMCEKGEASIKQSQHQNEQLLQQVLR